ncbi:SNF2 family N-terminal domain-containing protein [Durotheca rogersii]|uniref:SNF2 family N-terminal domain-containing protein n=1 Tax=Durotheca rogersii TaxID=419775 RepID=UPI002221166D|nr:SNF2 family N-terminal domain-containing protein [Durotheca rogersii]KAI5861653.1 SNF2 family N-terminal domain-containing protein [Durotheca rogersii]
MRMLSVLGETPGVCFEAVIPSNIFAKRQQRAKRGPQRFSLSINIFGSREAADDVALRLSKASAYLQHPQSLRAGVEYRNPQFLTFGEDLNMRDLVGIGNEPSWVLNTKISEEVERILESLTHTDVGTGEKLQLPSELTSTLKSRHQEDGLRFVLQREEETFNQGLSARLHRVVRFRTEPRPSTCFGGLVADAMGLGKTLTMLTAISHSMPEAEDFSNFYDKGVGKVPTKATLVVVSSARNSHFSPGALSPVRFHGQYRPRDTDILRSAGLVLTTYATLAADYARRRVLHQMEWYRVVLDEAHWIRNSSSKQFRAAASLHTRRRWCLTGTPIQNKLEDLSSLAQFLQLPPLSTKPAFQKHILDPLSEGGPDFAKPLRAYLEAYCLRRSENCLALPASRQENVTLQLTSEEQHLYDRLLKDTREQIDSLVSNGSDTSSQLFTAMLRMRMLCNLGTFSTVGARVDASGRQRVEIECERCSATQQGTLTLLDGYSFCPDCGRPLNRVSPLPDSANSWESGAESSRDGADMMLDDPPAGFSTKLAAVVHNITHSEPGTKSIVFSYWASTLNRLSELLVEAKITHCQIDGGVSYVERSKRLQAFREDAQVPVLLMSIGTGAVGLNLAVANKVHIVEPQWNPSVEEQAIARALRMGQTREVTIVRYMMENTVEKNIVNLQKRKRELAKFTFNTGTESSLETLEDLKSVLGVGFK